ncbi:ECF RNA polymerase sigma factor SigW [Planctomycetes bacterium Poly30]|uniref:ECF RNA polymerase sigma factor SigW n=1 Tax=Saltatorellus ferox TaxID=2528018 RepID=A0A518EW52_9BACT|nr:ECF RNA polymerase sigma factor SigW [Planctomycetes bacterium Poly30]
MDDLLPQDERLDLWLSSGETEHLADLFDRTAPALLRVAIHLVGDLSRAEDLVQATYLRLIQRRQQVEKGTRIDAWLQRVLKNLVIDERRGQAPALLDAKAWHVLEEKMPVDRPALRRELEARVAAAIDELGSPYREVLIARLRHGASAVEIAHLLDRAPGAVRTQLHRGLELLRARLPEREALEGIVALLGIPGQAGLEALRSSILQEARAFEIAAGSAMASSSLPFLSMLSLKESTAVVLSMAVALLAAVGALRALGPGGPVTAFEDAAEPVTPVATAPGPTEATTAYVEVASSARRTAQEPRPSYVVTGQVIDAETGQPLPGTSVRVIRPPAFTRSGSHVDLVREYPHLVRNSGDGGSSSAMGSDWPLPKHIAAGALAIALDGRNEILSEVETDNDGRFSMAAIEEIAASTLLEFEHPSRGVRLRPTPSPEEAEDSDLRVELFETQLLTGQVVGENQHPIAVSIPLSISTSRLIENPVLTEDGFYEPTSVETLDSQLVQTEADGTFTATVFGDYGSVSTIAPEASDGASFNFTKDQAALRIELKPRMRLLFVDAELRTPMEVLFLTLTSDNSDWTYLSGQHFLRGGVLPLDHTWGYLHNESPMTLTAWTASHAPTTLRLHDMTQAVDIEVALEMGTTPRLDVRIVRGEQPIQGAEVALIPARVYRWRPEQLRQPLTSARTGASGFAKLHGPEGAYLLQVIERPDSPEDGATTVSGVEIPSAPPFTVDLDTLATIHVQARVEGAAPEATIELVLKGPDGRITQPTLDDTGEHELTGLPPGAYTLSVIDQETRGAFPGQENRDLELAPGQRLELFLDLTPFEPVGCRLLHGSVKDFSSWTASLDGRTEWQPIAADGLLPQPALSDHQRFHIDTGEGRRYQFDLKDPVGDPVEIRLDRGALGYRGTLTDPSGSPLADHWIWAWPEVDTIEPPLPNVGARTDAAGRFELRDLASTGYVLQVKLPEETKRTWTSDKLGYSFLPLELPDASGRGLPLRIDLPETEVGPGLPVQGTLVDQSGAPVRGHVFARVHRLNSSGTLRIHDNGRRVSCDAAGHFEIYLPVGESCVVEGVAERSRGGIPPRAREEVFLKSEADLPSLRLVLP